MTLTLTNVCLDMNTIRRVQLAVGGGADVILLD